MKRESIYWNIKIHLTIVMVFLTFMTFFTSHAQTWDYKDSGTDFILLDLSIPSGQSDIAYAAGSLYTVNSEGIIIKTIDGGETWETIYPVSGTVPSFTKIEFITPLKGFAVGWGNTFLITEDGGETWQDVDAGTDVYHYTSLNFYNEDIGFAMALNNTSGVDSYLTNDGGYTWTEGADTSEMAEFAAAYADENTLFTVGKDQVISKSVDGGENWSIISTGANAMYNFRVFFRDVDNGIVTTEDGTILTTHDSGGSWDSFSTGYHNFYALNYKGNDVFAGGTDQDVFYSPDNGSTWSMIYDGPPTSTFYQIEFFADNTALICGSGGIMLKATDILGEITGPANDLCENAIAVECGETVSGDNTDATNTDNPGTCDTDLSTGPGVWYTLTIPADGDYDVTIDTFGSSYDTKLGVFSGDCGALVCVAGNDDAGGESQSEVIFEGTSGETYYIYVSGGSSSSGVFNLNVDCVLILGTSDNEIEGFSYYPNPTINSINLNAQDNIESVAIYNILGQKVVDQNSNATSIQLDVSNLVSGTYIMKVLVNGKTGTYKIVKE